MKFSHEILLFLIYATYAMAITACEQPSSISERQYNSEINQKTEETNIPESSSNPEVKAIAQKITVRIEGQNPGSGFIISRRGDTYYVLTNKHVVGTPDEYDIITPDGQRYRLNREEYDSKVRKLPNIDLAVVLFTSSNNYNLPELSETEKVPETTTVYVAGFPQFETINSHLRFTEGLVVSNAFAAEPLKDGYELIYNNPTLPGMSGGPVFDQQGRIVGIHGRAELISTETGWQKTGFNLAIPIQTFRELAWGVIDLRVTASTRTELIDNFYKSLFDKLQVQDAVERNCPGVTEVNYRSLKLTSPNSKTTVYFEGILKRSGKKQNLYGCRSETPINFVIESEDKVIKKQLANTDSYSFITPVSFSKKGRYLVADLEESDGYAAWNDFLVIDLKTNFQILEVGGCSQDQFGGDFKGFKSPTEIIFECIPGGQSVLEVINLQTGQVSRSPINNFEVFDQEYLSYGFVSELPKIIEIKEYPR